MGCAAGQHDARQRRAAVLKQLILASQRPERDTSIFSSVVIAGGPGGPKAHVVAGLDNHTPLLHRDHSGGRKEAEFHTIALRRRNGATAIF